MTQHDEILKLAFAVFEDKEKVDEWLTRPATALNQKRPIDVLEEPHGYEKVVTLLGQIKTGTYI